MLYFMCMPAIFQSPKVFMLMRPNCTHVLHAIYNTWKQRAQGFVVPDIKPKFGRLGIAYSHEVLYDIAAMAMDRA